MDVSLGLEDTHVLITGGAGLIGTVVAEAFHSAGANVTSLDIAYLPGEPIFKPKFIQIHCDQTSETSISNAWKVAVEKFGTVQACIALAALDLSVLPKHRSAADMDLDQFRRTLEVNVLGTFAIARQWMRGLESHLSTNQKKDLGNVSLLLVGSESGHWGEQHNADYGTSKAAVQYGLLQSLRQDVPKIFPGARVNAIAPGPVNTSRFVEECEANAEQYYEDCVATTALARPVEPEHVARSMIFLVSERFSGAVHGQIVNVDSGKLGKLVYRW